MGRLTVIPRSTMAVSGTTVTLPSPETVKKIGSVDARLSSLEREMTEVKALAIALQDILKKILDTDRQILNRLEKK